MAKDKRVEVLFEPRDYQRLEEIARRERKSVGSVVREAVAKYVTRPSDEEREAAWDRFFAMESGIDPGSPEDIKAVLVSGLDDYLNKNVDYSDDDSEAD
jgi:hypothetical protein